MQIFQSFIVLMIALGLAGCGSELSQEALKASVGMSKDQVESRFGKPQSSILEATDSHPGGYWVYKISSGGSCKLGFDLPPRVVDVSC
jgi:uncharacterized protein YceK